MAAFCRISVAPSNPNFPILQNLGTTAFSPPPPNKPKPPLSPPPPPPPPSVQFSEKSQFSPTRRRILSLSVVGFMSSLDQPFPFPRFLFLSKALASQMSQLDKYTDSPNKGSLSSYPLPGLRVDKAGATVLFEDANKRANSVSVVVSPTRISSLGEFGTPQFVADKLIQAERRKESSKEAEVISVSERSGLQVYEFEYKVDSTRGGLKWALSAAFVSSKRLYLLNITHSDGLDNPLEMETRISLEQVMHSFNAIP